MNWRPHTECPDTQKETVLIAIVDEEDGALLMSGIYIRRGCEFRHEDTNALPRFEQFWWIPEAEVLQGIPASRGVQR